MAELIARYIASKNKKIQRYSDFCRVLRGKDCSGYAYLSDEEMTEVWYCYLGEVAEVEVTV